MTMSKRSGRVILVFGFNVRDSGNGTTGRLVASFEKQGYDVIRTKFGWRGLLGVRFGNRDRANKLASMVQSGDILVGHSDGCNLITMAMRLLSSKRVESIFFNPALDRDTVIPVSISRTLVFHTRSDDVVWWSRWIPWHNWGAAGRDGLCVNARASITNISYESLGMPDLGHSGVFHRPNRVHRVMLKVSEWLRG
jgi:hypothetical protein